jgi:surface polysaccharide O-acyltransferase-like enzyme
VVILWVTALHNFILNFPETNVGNFLIWLGRNITSFYVIQWLIIGNIATEIFQTQPINSFLPWFAGIFATTALLTWLLEKMDVRLAK